MNRYEGLHPRVLQDLHQFYRERFRHYAGLDKLREAYDEELGLLEKEMDWYSLFYGTR